MKAPLNRRFALRAAVAASLLAGFFLLFSLADRNVWGFATLIAAALAAREWGALAGLRGPACALFVALLVVLCLLCATLLFDSAAAGGEDFLAVALGFWIVAAPWWIVRRWRAPPFVSCFAGALALSAAWFAALILFEYAPALLVVALGLTWLADAAGYFCGKLFGRAPLAPSLSPRKTWEGLAGALSAAQLLAVGLWLLDFGGAAYPLSFYLAFALAGLALAVLGDLFESMMKRAAGVKDSGRLLGGHGGVFDRIDSALPVLPLAGLLAPIMATPI